MTTGLHTVNMANKILDIMSGTTFTGFTNAYLQIHEADPGSAGTTSVVGTRKVMAWNAAASGSKGISSTISWTSWASGTKTITHVSVWDQSTSGNVVWTGPLSSPKTVNDGDTLNITALTAALTPLMA
jgi:hypothetical protein